MQDPEVLEEFKVEADEILNESEDFLLAMEKGDNFSENFNGIFRAFHSLKGAAGMFEIDELQTFMHTIETQFESLRNVGKVSQEQIDYFLKATDVARRILDQEAYEFDLDAFENLGKKAEPKQEVKEIKKVATERNEKQTASSKGLIYVVDDEEFICENLKDMLQSFGFSVQSFTEPLKAWETIQKVQPDLVCTDLKMPKMTGKQLLEEIRGAKYQTPVIFITGFVDNQLLTEGIDLGASGFLEKPFEKHEVVSLCHQTIERNRAKKLLNRSINFIIYQFNDLDNYLKNQGKETLRKSLKAELQNILKLRKETGI